MKYSTFHEDLRILLADDDEDDRQTFSEAIKAAKVRHVFHSVVDGSKLMTYLSDCTSECPDLIFLDLNMPKKDGMECLVEIRANPKYKNTAVVIYSTSSAQNEIDATFLAGANIYITKPNNMETLKTLIAEVVSINWQYHTGRLNKEHFMMVR